MAFEALTASSLRRISSVGIRAVTGQVLDERRFRLTPLRKNFGPSVQTSLKPNLTFASSRTPPLASASWAER